MRPTHSTFEIDWQIKIDVLSTTALDKPLHVVLICLSHQARSQV